REDAFGGTRCNDDAVGWIDRDPVTARGVIGDALTQFRQARSRRILVACTGAERFNRRIDQYGRTIEIWFTLTKINRVVLLRELVDFRENRRAERDDTVCDAGHGRPS